MALPYGLTYWMISWTMALILVVYVMDLGPLYGHENHETTDRPDEMKLDSMRLDEIRSDRIG